MYNEFESKACEYVYDQLETCRLKPDGKTKITALASGLAYFFGAKERPYFNNC
jgi:lipopolysaccharide export system protein LptC